MTRNELVDQQQLSQSKQDAYRPGGRIISWVRTIGVALMLFAGAFSVGYADHMGNHERGPAEATESTSPDSSQACGQDIVDIPSTTDEEEEDSADYRGLSPW